MADPRILRTRRLLQQSMQDLLQAKEFEQITVQDVTAAATLNRATFYDHYPDKYALLECTVATRFQELLARRAITFTSDCSTAVKGLVLGVCDYLSEWPRKVDPHMESAIIAVVRRMILDGLKMYPFPGPATAEMLAAMVSCAIHGAAKEWLATPGRGSSEEIAETITQLITPLLHQR